MTVEHREKSGQFSRRLAVACARILDEHKMENVTVLQVEPFLHITDYFIVATGRNAKHLASAADRLFEYLREHGVSRSGVEGYKEGKWVLVDLVDVVAHLFDAESRSYYDLELLWGDCPRVDWAAEATDKDAAEQNDRLSAEGDQLHRAIGNQ